MITVFSMLTPGCQNQFMDCQKVKVRIAVSPIMDVKTHWNSRLRLLERTYLLREFTREWLHNLKHDKYCRLFTTLYEWTIVKYITEGLCRFRYWNLWMSKMYKVTLRHSITVYNDMFNPMDGVMQVLAKKKSQWKDDFFFTVK
jgi:hypothetical protein